MESAPIHHKFTYLLHMDNEAIKETTNGEFTPRLACNYNKFSPKRMLPIAMALQASLVCGQFKVVESWTGHVPAVYVFHTCQNNGKPWKENERSTYVGDMLLYIEDDGLEFQEAEFFVFIDGGYCSLPIEWSSVAGIFAFTDPFYSHMNK